MPSDPLSLPRAFGERVANELEHLLQNQQPDGSIVLLHAPLVYPQQAIMPLAYCWAGLDPQARWRQSPRVREAIIRLGDYLCRTYDDRGRFCYDSFGYKVEHVCQRLTYAWCEALRILREAGGDFDFAAWEDKILRACNTLWDDRVKRLSGLRRFFGRVMGTSTNHVALYLSTIYRAGEVLGRPSMGSDVLPIARALAADIHPDGYWEEHSDLARRGGPTPSYNYLTHQGFSLLYEWTGDKAFFEAIERSSRFHANFCYPDATFLDTIDERVRYGHSITPRIWGLFGFSHWPWGRGSAISHFRGFSQRVSGIYNLGEELARQCENAMYWHDGPIEPAPFERPSHEATLAAGAAVMRRGAWSLSGCSMPARNAEDPAYVGNPFALDRQKLFSVWHERTGLLIDGSNSKRQPANSTFVSGAAIANAQASHPDELARRDYYPDGGSVETGEKGLTVHGLYKTFEAHVRLEPDGDDRLIIRARVEPAACPEPVSFAFTLKPAPGGVKTLAGPQQEMGEQPWELNGEALGGGFTLGALTIRGPAGLSIQWPMSPFNSYHKDGKSEPSQNLLRVAVGLTREMPEATLMLEIAEA